MVIERFESIDSTNEECKRVAKDPSIKRYVCSSLEQTKGKGRLGKTWQSEKGDGIYLSILERAAISTEDAPSLTLIMALVAESVIDAVTGVHCKIKWPNDLVVNGRKVSGILCEMALKPEGGLDYVVMGIGINLYHKEFPEDIRDTATSLCLNWDEKDLIYENTVRESLEEGIVAAWERYLDIFEKEGFKALREEYEDKCLSIGRTIKVLDPKGDYIARGLGVDEDGGLVVEKEDGKIETIRSGEVSVRGVYGYV